MGRITYVFNNVFNLNLQDNWKEFVCHGDAACFMVIDRSNVCRLLM